jgi:hypothetical protein
VPALDLDKVVTYLPAQRVTYPLLLELNPDKPEWDVHLVAATARWWEDPVRREYIERLAAGGGPMVDPSYAKEFEKQDERDKRMWLAFTWNLRCGAIDSTLWEIERLRLKAADFEAAGDSRAEGLRRHADALQSEIDRLRGFNDNA